VWLSWARCAVGLQVVEGSSTAVLTCLYCSEPADADALPPAEPLWRCALCAAACHVQCWCDAHPQLPAVATKLRALMNATSGGAGSDGRQARQAQHGEVGRPHPGQPDGPLARPLDSVGSSGSSGSGSSEDGEAGEPVGAATHAEPDGGERGFPATPPPPPRRANGASWLQRLAATVGFRRKGAAAAGGDVAARDESGYCSDSESGKLCLHQGLPAGASCAAQSLPSVELCSRLVCRPLRASPAA
jgi:hypothetical protein